MTDDHVIDMLLSVLAQTANSASYYLEQELLGRFFRTANHSLSEDELFGELLDFMAAQEPDVRWLLWFGTKEGADWLADCVEAGQRLAVPEMDKHAQDNFEYVLRKTMLRYLGAHTDK